MSASASPSSTPSATASTEDVLAQAATSYYRTLQQAAADPSKRADGLERLIASDCACKDVVALLRRLAREHHRLMFTVTVGHPRVARVESTGGTVFITVKQSAGREVDERGALVRPLPPSNGDYALDFVTQDGRWLIRQITRTP